MATSISRLTLLASPFPLVQCTRLEMDEPSMGDVNFIEDNLLDQLKELYLTELYLDKTPLRSFFFLW